MLKFRAKLNSAEAYKEFFSAKNKEFADKLPAGVKVTYISAYSPLINATAAKEDIYKIAEMEDVSSISEGEKYIATDVNSTNKNTSDEIVYFNSTLTVNGVKTSFIENEYYKVYADFYGKYFYDNFKKNPPQNKIDKNLYSNIKQLTNECYITVILKDSSKKAEDIAQALNIGKDAVIAACKSYPAAMIKILPNSINALIANINVDAIYNAFPAATAQPVVTDALMAETYAPKSSDARKILRYVLRLDSAPENMADGKKFFFMSDSNLDGEITSADARTALRIALKLENGKTYYKEYNGSGAFWQESYCEN